jgi:hypothetical protein
LASCSYAPLRESSRQRAPIALFFAAIGAVCCRRRSGRKLRERPPK